MQMLPHGNLGKEILVEDTAAEFCLPPSGVSRLLASFCIIAALVLFFDAAALRGKPAAPDAALQASTQQGR